MISSSPSQKMIDAPAAGIAAASVREDFSGMELEPFLE
jgi:hypothetical protein